MKCKECVICLTADYELIRNCELRGGRFPECEANNLARCEKIEDIVIDWQELRRTSGAKK